MKKIKYYIAILILPVFICLLNSCNDTYEFHQKYISEGETLYATKIDSVKTLPGNNRIKLSGYLSNAFDVETITVYWDNKANNQVFSYSKSEEDIDMIELIVENLEEKSYEFEIYTSDSNGNNSIRVTVFGTVYGENYRSNLEARLINSFNVDENDNATVNFNIASELTRATEIKYTNLSGTEIVNTVLNNESETVLEQVDMTAPIMYRTFYVPIAADDEGHETTIDEFDSDWETFVFPSNIDAVFESMSIEPILGGLLVSWENATHVEINLTFEKMVGGNPVSNTVTSSESVDSFVLGGMEGGTQNIKISIGNLFGAFKSLYFEVTPLPIMELDKSSWSIVDFSSEEANGEGPVNGHVSAVIDGDTGTFWHSQWDGASPGYPHHFTIDLGEERDIAHFDIYRRGGDDRGATVHEFWVSSDGISFNMVAALNAKLENDNAYTATAAAFTKGRYVKYIAIEGPNNFTHLAEISIYGN
ncbi:DUF4998 domain-containing protein [Flavivirga sp. 57AJ16]|uniref:DUF4998 domain-containing protein n=1 Tax=Flavivirga sp. 57AJ16 TaxID=3025307 RepID=UPI0023670216|nr:DUF4998 domain-containing protein [Flavivirga sp. 57AJ16]MDD7887718.1 DUF4998 domain-containing protein [Flavivirga sp. 57AJ16]